MQQVGSFVYSLSLHILQPPVLLVTRMMTSQDDIEDSKLTVWQTREITGKRTEDLFASSSVVASFPGSPALECKHGSCEDLS